MLEPAKSGHQIPCFFLCLSGFACKLHSPCDLLNAIHCRSVFLCNGSAVYTMVVLVASEIILGLIRIRPTLLSTNNTYVSTWVWRPSLFLSLLTFHSHKHVANILPLSYPLFLSRSQELHQT